MFSPKHILAPTDFSENCNDALAYAGDIANTSHAEMHIIHVKKPPVYPAQWGLSSLESVDLEKKMNDAVQKELEQRRADFALKGIRTKFAILNGRTHEEILAYADANNIDLICMATHGRGGLEHFMLGSVTERVLRKARCPVLVIRSDAGGE